MSQAVSPELAAEVLERLRSGESTIGKERDKLGFTSNTPLRKAIIALLDGGKDEYLELIQCGRVPERVAITDEGVERVKHVKGDGWTLLGWLPDIRDIHVSPEGTLYEPAPPSGRAGIILEFVETLPPRRLREVAPERAKELRAKALEQPTAVAVATEEKETAVQEVPAAVLRRTPAKAKKQKKQSKRKGTARAKTSPR